MEQEKKKNVNYIVIILLVILVVVICCVLFSKKNNNTQENNIQEISTNDLQDETILNEYDENAINEIKQTIEELEIKYINDNNNSKEYSEGVFAEISKITSDNYKKYFNDEEEYGTYVLSVFMKFNEYVVDTINNFGEAKINTQIFSNRILPLLEQSNKYIDYMQENSNIFFKESYTNIQQAKYDSMQKEIAESFIFLNMEFAQNMSDIIEAYNIKELPTQKEKYDLKAQYIAEKFVELRNSNTNLKLNDFIANNYPGDVTSIKDSILSDINTFSNFTNTYNEASRTSVSGAITTYGKLLEMVGDDVKY